MCVHVQLTKHNHIDDYNWYPDKQYYVRNDQYDHSQYLYHSHQYIE